MAKKPKKKLNIRVSSLLPFEVIVPRPSTLKPTQEARIVLADDSGDGWTEEVWRVFVTNRGRNHRTNRSSIPANSVENP